MIIKDGSAQNGKHNISGKFNYYIAKLIVLILINCVRLAHRGAEPDPWQKPSTHIQELDHGSIREVHHQDFPMTFLLSSYTRKCPPNQPISGGNV